MNETGSYPGQPWLWLYTLWYQVPGWTNSANIDMIAVYMTGAGTAASYGLPDYGLLTMTEMVANAARIVACTSVPLIARITTLRLRALTSDSAFGLQA